MKHISFMQISTLALLASFPLITYAEVENSNKLEKVEDVDKVNKVNNEEKVGEMDKVGKKMSDALESVRGNVKGAYDDIRARMICESDDEEDSGYVFIDQKMTALGVFGHPIVNNTGESLGSAEDIIIDSTGKAESIILKGGYFKLGGKLVSFSYDLVMVRESNGDMVVPLSVENVDRVKSFSYDRSEESDKVSIIPEKSMSAKGLMDGNLTDNNGKVVAQVDNIYFKNGNAVRVIFSFDKTMGMGGRKAIMNFAELKISVVEGVYQFAMNEKQSKKFDSFSKDSEK